MPQYNPTTIFLQDACLLHQFIRSKDTSNVVERPERLRAVTLGIAAAIARCEEVYQPQDTEGNKEAPPEGTPSAEQVLAVALERLNIGSKVLFPMPALPLQVHKSTAALDVLNHAAVKFVHGDIEGDVYLENLIRWAKESRDKIANDGTEIPAGLSEGDLYFCPTSMDAIQGALATVCESVDTVIANSRQSPENVAGSSRSSFVAIRPPGHHCGEDTPSGFCFVNNVVVGAAHAHLKHGITRAVIFDIDLHHGNGTQSLIWQINEETYRQQLQEAHGAPVGNPALQVFYGSLHDILSYPCEDGKLELVQAASVSIHGPHGQYVENMHLLPYTSEDHFWKELYQERYTKLFDRAATFMQETAKEGRDDDVLVFVSCGFDACEHEHESMSRHGRKVPVGFYHRFAQDAQVFANNWANGRIISVLEGGYSDKALTSGAMAHVSGLAGLPYRPEWWSEDNLAMLEKAAKKRRGGRASLNPNTPQAAWVDRALQVFAAIGSTPPPAQPVAPPISMTLRGKSKGVGTASSKTTSPPKATIASQKKTKKGDKPQRATKIDDNPVLSSGALGSDPADAAGPAHKKLPRVILKLGPDTRSTASASASDNSS